MKIELHIEEDSLNTRKIEALLISKADLDRLEEKLPGSCELYRDNEVSEATKSEVYQLTGHGNEPLGEVQKALRAALPHWDGKLLRHGCRLGGLQQHLPRRGGGG